MTDLTSLLDRAAGDPAPLDVDGDLRRGRRALHRRRTRLAAGVAGGLVVVGGATFAALPRGTSTVAVEPADDPTPPPATVHTTFFDLPTPPAGWHVDGSNAFQVVLRRDGDPVTGDSDFSSAIVVYVEDAGFPFDAGTTVEYDGRSFQHFSEGGAGADQLAVRDPSGSWLRIQYPFSAGLATQDMLAFLDAVVVKPGAQSTRG